MNEPTSRRAYAAYMLVLIVLANTLSYADRSLFAVLLPAIKAEFDASDGALGLIGGPGFIISYIVFSMPLARLADQWSRRGVLALSAATWSIAAAACGLVAGLWQLAIARVMVGVGEAGGLPPSQSIVAELFSDRRRSSAMGVLSSSTYIGLLIGLAGGAIIAGIWGWRAAFLALALPGIPVAALIWFTGPRRQLMSVESPRVGESALSVIRRCLRIRSLRLLALGIGIFNIFGYAAAIWMPAYFMRSHGMSVVAAGAWLGIGAAVGGIAGTLVSGPIVDALVRRDLHWQLRLPALGILLSFPMFIVMMLLPGGASVSITGYVLPVAPLLSIVTAFLSSLWMGPGYSAASRLVPTELRAQAIAMLVVIINLVGNTAGPVIAGIASDLFTIRFEAEALRYSLLAMSVLTAVGGVFLWQASTHYMADLAHRDRA